jgi:hypothetical protein
MVGPSGNNADGEGRRAEITLAEERIQDPGTMLRQLFGPEEKPALPANSGPVTISDESICYLCLHLFNIAQICLLTGAETGNAWQREE